MSYGVALLSLTLSVATLMAIMLGGHYRYLGSMDGAATP